MKYTDNFTSEDISLEDLSQILWAGYGCTPHTTYNGRGGLTVPSWCAEYYLTENIYVVKQDGVFRYHNRNPGSDLTTRDHRLELIKGGDVRENLRSVMRELPDAPCYVILCLDTEDMDRWYAHLETGFVGGNMLLQGSALGMGCWFTAELSGDVQVEIREVIGVEVDDVPYVIVSVGMFDHQPEMKRSPLYIFSCGKFHIVHNVEKDLNIKHIISDYTNPIIL